MLCCLGGWLVAEVGWRVEEEGSRTRKTHAVACFSCSGGGWLHRWGAEVEGLGKGAPEHEKPAPLRVFRVLEVGQPVGMFEIS